MSEAAPLLVALPGTAVLSPVWRVQFLVPKRFNHGRRVSGREHRRFRDELLCDLPGLTCRGAVEGFWWWGARLLMREPLQEYYVDLPSAARADAVAVRVAECVAHTYNQAAVEVNVSERRSTVFARFAVEPPSARPASPIRLWAVFLALLCCARCDQSDAGVLSPGGATTRSVSRVTAQYGDGAAAMAAVRVAR